MHWARAIIISLWRAVGTFFANEGFILSSHIALSILLAIFPFAIGVAALAGLFGTTERIDSAALLLLDIWPQQVAEPLIREMRLALGAPHGGVLTAGSALALYFSSNGIEALRSALNRAYGEFDPRPWWLLRLQSLIFAALGVIASFALAALIVLGPLAFELITSAAPMLAPFRFVLTLLRFATAIAALAIALLAIHMWLPAGHRRMRDVLPGIALTIIASLIAGAAFGEYLARFATGYSSTYAGLASPIIALAYLNYMAIIFIYGGEWNAALMKRHRAKSEDQREAPATIA